MVGRLCGKSRGAQKQPTVGRDGADLSRGEARAEEFAWFSERKFACTDREGERVWPPLSDAAERESCAPTEEEMRLCLKALKRAKAVGPDGIPVEVFQQSKKARADLFQ